MPESEQSICLDGIEQQHCHPVTRAGAGNNYEDQMHDLIIGFFVTNMLRAGCYGISTALFALACPRVCPTGVSDLCLQNEKVTIVSILSDCRVSVLRLTEICGRASAHVSIVNSTRLLLLVQPPCC